MFFWICLFTFSFFFLFYSYLGYPLGVILWAKYKGESPSKSWARSPKVSVVLSTFNEEKNIKRKIKNLQALHYPKGDVEIIVVDDSSTDQTLKILQEIENISVFSNEIHQKGKPSALNKGVAEATGELILFCDARQIIEENALRCLVNPFQNDDVGAVSGELILESGQGPGMYWKYEKAIRKAEGTLNSVPGATGALYMIRKELFQPIPENCLLDDVFTPMQIVLQGKRVLFEPKALVYDQETSMDREFSRKARTLAGNFQLLEMLPNILSPKKNPIFWQFLSHKLFRLFCPYALLLFFISSFYLSIGTVGFSSFFFWSCWGIQVFCYGMAGVHIATEKGGRLGRLCSTFVVLNLAAVAGLLRYLRRDFNWT